MISSHLDFRIPFQDVDSMQVVWHGNYVRYFEQARSELLRDIGFTYGDMAARGFVFPVVKLNVKYVAPARFDERVRAVAELLPCENCLDVRYRLVSLEDGRLFCKATTRQMAVRLSTGESLLQLPEPLLTLMREFEARGSLSSE